MLWLRGTIGTLGPDPSVAVAYLQFILYIELKYHNFTFLAVLGILGTKANK